MHLNIRFLKSVEMFVSSQVCIWLLPALSYQLKHFLTPPFILGGRKFRREPEIESDLFKVTQLIMNKI